MLNNFSSKFKIETYESGTNGMISDSIVQSWTPQAIECYKNNFDCNHCFIKKANFSFKCKMKDVVDILLKTIGEPENTSEQSDSVA